MAAGSRESEPGFRVVGSEILVDAGFLQLARLSVASADGEEFDRHVVHHPGAVVVVPVLENGDAVLVRQWRVATGRDLLEVPAGKRDVAGEPPEVTANRELEEEIGYVGGRLDKLAEFYNSPGFCDEHSFLFLATDLTPCATDFQGHEEQYMTIERVPLDDVPALIAAGDLTDGKSIIALLLAREHLAR